MNISTHFCFIYLLLQRTTESWWVKYVHDLNSGWVRESQLIWHIFHMCSPVLHIILNPGHPLDHPSCSTTLTVWFFYMASAVQGRKQTWASLLGVMILLKAIFKTILNMFSTNFQPLLNVHNFLKIELANYNTISMGTLSGSTNHSFWWPGPSLPSYCICNTT